MSFSQKLRLSGSTLLTLHLRKPYTVTPLLSLTVAFSSASSASEDATASIYPYSVLSTPAIRGETPWLRLETLDWFDATGRKRKWDRAVRTTTSAAKLRSESGLNSGTDAVAVLGVVTSPSESRTANEENSNDSHDDSEKIILVKQFRPALGCFTLELPAGLIDAGETPEQAGIRELREETGAKPVDGNIETSPSLPLSPGLTDESVAVVGPVRLQIESDLNSTKASESTGESTEVIRISQRHMKRELLRLVRENEELRIFQGLWLLAEGIEMGKKMGSLSNKKTKDEL